MLRKEARDFIDKFDPTRWHADMHETLARGELTESETLLVKEIDAELGEITNALNQYMANGDITRSVQ